MVIQESRNLSHGSKKSVHETLMPEEMRLLGSLFGKGA